MRKLQCALLALLTLCCLQQSASARVAAPKGKRAAVFQGRWQWIVYPTSRSELPPAYRHMKLKEVPRHSLVLTLRQRGNRLRGAYDTTARYLAKLDDGEFTTTIRGDTARFELESGFGGRVTVRISLRGTRLYWKVIKSEGAHYFPDDVVLRRLR